MLSGGMMVALLLQTQFLQITQQEERIRQQHEISLNEARTAWRGCVERVMARSGGSSQPVSIDDALSSCSAEQTAFHDEIISYYGQTPGVRARSMADDATTAAVKHLRKRYSANK